MLLDHSPDHPMCSLDRYLQPEVVLVTFSTLVTVNTWCHVIWHDKLDDYEEDDRRMLCKLVTVIIVFIVFIVIIEPLFDLEWGSPLRTPLCNWYQERSRIKNPVCNWHQERSRTIKNDHESRIKNQEQLCFRRITHIFVEFQNNFVKF